MEAAGRRVSVDLSKIIMAMEVILACLQDGSSLEDSTTPGCYVVTCFIHQPQLHWSRTHHRPTVDPHQIS
ncbi:hypothetical protein BN1723_005114, partial [Verticillium longisporum]